MAGSTEEPRWMVPLRAVCHAHTGRLQEARGDLSSYLEQRGAAGEDPRLLVLANLR